MGRVKRRSSLLARIAAMVALCYAAAFMVVALVIGFQFISGTGSIGREHLSGVAARGPTFLAVALLVAAGVLIVGVTRVLRSAGSRWLVWPLALFVGTGLIGETVDLFGTASGRDDAIGAGILMLAMVAPTHRGRSAAPHATENRFQRRIRRSAQRRFPLTVACSGALPESSRERLRELAEFATSEEVLKNFPE